MVLSDLEKQSASSRMNTIFRRLARSRRRDHKASSDLHNKMECAVKMELQDHLGTREAVAAVAAVADAAGVAPTAVAVVAELPLGAVEEVELDTLGIVTTITLAHVEGRAVDTRTMVLEMTARTIEG